MSAKPILTVIVADKGAKLSDLAIGDRQLIFVGDQRKIAVDFNGKRTFYNQIEVLTSEAERLAIEAPVSGLFYFTCEPAALWHYDGQWRCAAAASSNAVFIGSALPTAGAADTLYVDKQKKNISVWDADTAAYVVVAEKINEISEDEIASLFS